MVDIQSATAEIMRGKKEERRKKEERKKTERRKAQDGDIMACSITQGGHNKF